MFKEIRNIFLLLMYVQIGYTQTFTEKSVLDYRKSSGYINNYHGLIKSSFWYYTFVKKPIPSTEALSDNTQEVARNNFMRKNSKVLGGNVYHEFDRKGRLTVSMYLDIDGSYFGKSKIDLKKASIYIYDEDDWERKNRIKLKKRQIYPVDDHFILVRLNYCTPIGDTDTLKYKYDYIVDDNGKINKRINFDGEKKPYTETEYIYDNNDNIKQLNIVTKQQSPIAFHFLDTETGFCPDLHISYEYDNQDRMTQVTYYGCKDTLAYEKYVYDPQKGYVKERTRYIESSMRDVAHVTNTMIFYHNENGDIIEQKYVPDRLNGKISGGNFYLPESVYYKYEYDKYNNWVKCYIYMEGKPDESEPTAIAQRDLEYYES